MLIISVLSSTVIGYRRPFASFALLPLPFAFALYLAFAFVLVPL